MTSEPVLDGESAPPPAGFDLDWGVARSFAAFSKGFWQGGSARQAWMLTIALAACLIASTAATVVLNHWTRWFFDALERRDGAALWSATTSFFLIVAAMAAIGVGIVLARERLQVRWRAWMIDTLVGRWLERQRFYHMAADGSQPANPEYRIADDSRWATEPLVDLGIGLVIATFAAAAFISILWTVGGSLTVTVGDSRITIPAYMVLVALIYGIAASALTMWIGRPLIGFVGRKNEAEGDFRFALMRLRDNAESIALMRGEASERRILAQIYGTVVERWLLIVRRHGLLTWVTNASGPMIPVIPLLFAAPKYLRGELTLGQVTQIAAAFGQVQMAISWMVDNYARIADWYASARRVMDMVDACDSAERKLQVTANRITVDHHARPADALTVAGVSVAAPGGATLVASADLSLRPASTTMVVGGTSVGKSSLVRAIAGLWRRGQGRISAPDGLRIMIAPQRSYLPLGTLRDVLAYPGPPVVGEAAELTRALHAVGLAHLESRLEATARWDQLLSAGERQRLTVARALLQKPDVLILDDALTALDEATQARLVAVLRTLVPQVAILSLGQSVLPIAGAEAPLVLRAGDGGAVLNPPHVDAARLPTAASGQEATIRRENEAKALDG